MAWEWSHSPEAYEAAEQNLHKLGVGKLREIWAEWQVKLAETEEDEDGWDSDVYTRSITLARSFSKEQLAEQIWGWMEAQATCDNGGHEAWACPYGCGCHTVSFG